MKYSYCPLEYTAAHSPCGYRGTTGRCPGLFGVAPSARFPAAKTIRRTNVIIGDFTLPIASCRKSKG